jgi:outer membrane protein OmpA-like peptidoglycan-associated protein
MKYTKLSTTLIATAVLIAGCASTPKRVEQLEQARADVQTLSQDPLAQQAAAQELKNARESLDRAEAALKEGEREDVIHYSHLASQQAQTGQERVAEARAKEQVAKGEAERNRVLLEARTREAEAAKAAAEEQARTAQAQAQQAEAARAEAEAAQRQLAELQAKQTERGMVLTLGDVLFDTAAATLKPGAGAVLDRVAGFLKQNEGTKVMIEGHTDSRGSEEYNELLSQRRAAAVADALSFRGIDRGRVEAVGRGETLPVASNDTSAGQQQNRRVEIVFSDASGRFASEGSATLR